MDKRSINNAENISVKQVDYTLQHVCASDESYIDNNEENTGKAKIRTQRLQSTHIPRILRTTSSRISPVLPGSLLSSPFYPSPGKV